MIHMFIFIINAKLFPIWLPVCRFINNMWNPIYEIKFYWNSNHFLCMWMIPCVSWLAACWSIICIYLWMNLYFLHLSLICWVNLSTEFLLPSIHIYKCISLLKFFLIYLILFEFCLFFHFSPSMYLNFITKGLLLTLLHTFISCFALNSLLILNKPKKNLLLFFVLFCF